MQVVIRVDASIPMGTGHVVRCLALANELKSRGAEVAFVSREHKGNLCELIEQNGYTLHKLPAPLSPHSAIANPHEPHAHWLAVDWQQDAMETCAILKLYRKVDWIIVDHYAIDAKWEQVIRPKVKRIMFLDDLIDRPHNCEILVSQVLDITRQNYGDLLPEKCRVHSSPDYAILRSEFVNSRPAALKRREQFKKVKHILVTMGGMDKDNHTQKVLNHLLPELIRQDRNVQIDVVVRSQMPGFEQVVGYINKTSLPVNLIVDSCDMAGLMARSDICIASAGGTTWERFCLGLPTLAVIMIEHQKELAQNLEKLGVQLSIDMSGLEGDGHIFLEKLKILLDSDEVYRQLWTGSSAMVDGIGCQRIVDELVKLSA